MNRDSLPLHVLAAIALVVAWIALLVVAGNPLLSSFVVAGLCFAAMRAVRPSQLRALWFNLGTVLALIGAFTGYVESQSQFLQNEQ